MPPVLVTTISNVTCSPTTTVGFKLIFSISNLGSTTSTVSLSVLFPVSLLPAVTKLVQLPALVVLKTTKKP